MFEVANAHNNMLAQFCELNECKLSQLQVYDLPLSQKGLGVILMHLYMPILYWKGSVV